MAYAVILLGFLVLTTNIVIGARYGLYKAGNNTLEEN
jgi:hypothetical protein